MSIIEWDPMRDMQALMNRFPAAAANQGVQNAFIPRVDVYETKESVVVETPLAGMNPDNVEVSVEKNMLTIEGEHKQEREIDEKNYYRKEMRSGSFYRQVPLPVSVKEEGVEAVFEEGILKITCPKETPTAVKKD